MMSLMNRNYSGVFAKYLEPPRARRNTRGAHDQNLVLLVFPESYCLVNCAALNSRVK